MNFNAIGTRYNRSRREHFNINTHRYKKTTVRKYTYCHTNVYNIQNGFKMFTLERSHCVDEQVVKLLEWRSADIKADTKLLITGDTITLELYTMIIVTKGTHQKFLIILTILKIIVINKLRRPKNRRNNAQKRDVEMPFSTLLNNVQMVNVTFLQK